MIGKKKGLLIAIEGIDGAGKRTLGSFMKTYLESRNFEVVPFAYPDYSGKWGKLIEDYLENRIELSVNEQFFLYLIDIMKDQENIRNLLDDGKIVITDRYFYSTIAFQCSKGFSFEKALSIIGTMGLIEADIALFIKIPPNVALDRKFKQKSSLDRHEKDVELLENVTKIYEQMCNHTTLSKNWSRVNGDQYLESVKSEIVNILKGI